LAAAKADLKVQTTVALSVDNLVALKVEQRVDLMVAPRDTSTAAMLVEKMVLKTVAKKV
jgi:hypothetical protein